MAADQLESKGGLLDVDHAAVLIFKSTLLPLLDQRKVHGNLVAPGIQDDILDLPAVHASRLKRELLKTEVAGQIDSGHIGVLTDRQRSILCNSVLDVGLEVVEPLCPILQVGLADDVANSQLAADRLMNVGQVTGHQDDPVPVSNRFVLGPVADIHYGAAVHSQVGNVAARE